MMLNEMAMLGDLILGTLLPLRFRMGFSKQRTKYIGDNQWEFVIESADMFCRDI
jgi:hypothetical protein